MIAENMEQWFKASKNWTTPLGELSKVTTEWCRKLAQQNLEIAGDNFTRFSERLKKLSSVKKPEDFFNLQKECIYEDMANAVANMRKIFDTSLEGFEELHQCCSSIREQAVKTAEKEKTNK